MGPRARMHVIGIVTSRTSWRYSLLSSTQKQTLASQHLRPIPVAALAHVMSIDINWETATSGPDGEALAERIRSFIHDKFQQVALPRFIRSVQVHSFDFGTIPPELEIRDLCDPFADFYEEDEDDISDASEELSVEQQNQYHLDPSEHSLPEDIGINQQLRIPPGSDFHSAGLRSPIGLGEHLNSHFLAGAGAPGIPGGTSNLGYHLMSLGSLSGTQTPLAAVAGRSPFGNGWPDSVTDARARIRSQGAAEPGIRRRSDVEGDNSSPSRPSTANTIPSRPSQVPSAGSSSNNTSGDPTIGFNEQAAPSLSMHHENEGVHDDPSIAAQPHQPPRHMRERRPEDFQVICCVKYAGDVKLSLTAEILLDYPMPSFVGLPLKLNITGLTFDGVAVIAYIRRRAHLCFLSPEDADALLGAEEDQRDRDPTAHDHPGVEDIDNHPRGGDASASALSPSPSSSRKRFGSLLQQIRVESEIGRKENGKQVLKNVGKVERFVLDQVRRIFEDEFVFPSYWTFLI